MDAVVVRKFWMKSRRHGVSLPDHHRITALSRQDFYIFADAFNLGGADENHFQRRVGLEKFAFADGAVDLASIGIAADADVECAEALLFGIVYFVRKQDRSRAGAEGGFHCDKLFQLFEPGLAQQIQESSGFAPGNHQTVDLVELLGLLDEHNFSTQLFKPAAVRVEITLQG